MRADFLPIILLAFSPSPELATALYIAAALLATGPSLRAWFVVLDRLKGRQVDVGEFASRDEFRDLKEAIDDLKADLGGIQRSIGRLEGKAGLPH